METKARANLVNNQTHHTFSESGKSNLNKLQYHCLLSIKFWDICICLLDQNWTDDPVASNSRTYISVWCNYSWLQDEMQQLMLSPSWLQDEMLQLKWHRSGGLTAPKPSSSKFSHYLPNTNLILSSQHYLLFVSSPVLFSLRLWHSNRHSSDAPIFTDLFFNSFLLFSHLL